MSSKMSRLSDSQENGCVVSATDSIVSGTAVSGTGSGGFSSKIVIGKNMRTKDWQP
jgi:hypothetical protein